MTPVRCAAIPCSRWRSICRPIADCVRTAISRLENLPDARALLRMGLAAQGPCCAGAAPWSIFIASPRHEIPKRITLDIDDAFGAVHGGQQLRLFNAHYDEYGFQPIVVFDGGGRFITAVLRPAKRPSCEDFAARNSRQGIRGKEIKAFLRRRLQALRANWPKT
jgi:hypothetical protein